MLNKVDEIKALDRMRKDLLQKRVTENESEKIWDDFEENKQNIEQKIHNDENESVLDKTENTDSEQVYEISNFDGGLVVEKQKKLLEKIHYSALKLKKEWKLDLYEKKLIEWLAIDSNYNEFNQMLSDLYFAMWKYNKSLTLLKKIIEKDPENHSAIRQLWEIYLIKFDFETAELLIEKAIDMKPSNPKYYISLVDIYYNTDRKKEAINIMEKIVRLRPTNANYIFTLWTLYEEIWDLDSAKKYYFRVMECEPSNEKAKKKLKDLS